MPTSKGLYLHGPKTLVLEERPLPAPAATEIQIAIRSTTLCGSDVHYYTYHRNGSIQVKEPLCGGHEAAGEVVNIGSDVRDTGTLSVGDKVAIEPGVPCSRPECKKCMKGRYNVCPGLRFRSSGASFPHFQGTLQEVVNHPASWVHKLPVSLEFDDGALLEPLSVCIHAVRKARMEGGETCLVFGAGAVGLLSAAVVKIEHGCRVVIVDVDPGRVEFAVKEGFADVGFTVTPRKGETVDEKLGIAKDVAREIGELKWPGPEGERVGRVDVVLECTGVESCVQASIYAADSGGKVVLIGMGTAVQSWPISELTAREIDIVSVWRYANCYPRAIEIMDAMASRGLTPDARKIITHRFSGLDSIPDAYETAAKTKDGKGGLVIKTVVNL
ncbi:NAD(P)-dependent alcohol dehydrogenase [Aspergillus lucknowensis]|uniref:Chaperonin 10-like protein n=1 Tax=Aspergillus lucknowensis TaxID=176173 RepID=A0ABR4M4A4_9EURO